VLLDLETLPPGRRLRTWRAAHGLRLGLDHFDERKLIEQVGGRMEAFYWMLGEWDGFEGGEEVKQRSTCSTGKSWRKSSSCPGIRV